MYQLQVVHPDGTILRFNAGETVEMDLRAEIKAAILKRDVGFLKTQAQVAEAIDAGIADALESFKAKIAPWKVK